MLRQASVDAPRRSGFAPEVLNRLDRIFVCHPLRGLDIARLAALAIEAMIQGYGLEVAEGGIDAALLFEMMQRQSRLGDAASARDLTRTIDETIGDSLIAARQRHAGRVRLVSTPAGVVVEYFFDPAAPTQPERWSREAVAHEPAARDLVRRISRWSERWTPLLERGAAGTLQAAEVAAARSPDDPDAMRQARPVKYAASLNDGPRRRFARVTAKPYVQRDDILYNTRQ